MKIATAIVFVAFLLFGVAPSVRAQGVGLDARLGAGSVAAARGRGAFDRGDFVAAAAHYSEAAEGVPRASLTRRWFYRMHQARSLYTRGSAYNEPERLRESLRVLESMALPLVPRETYPPEWAQTRRAIGFVLSGLGRRGDHDALLRAVREHELALSELPRDEYPDLWAEAQTTLGATLVVLGEHGVEGALEQGIGALEAALAVRTRDHDPLGWAQTRMAIGSAFYVRGSGGDGADLDRSRAGYEAALTVLDPDREPRQWGAAQIGLGNLLVATAGRRDSPRLSAALAAYQRALSVLHRENNPNDWALAQAGIGSAMGARGDATSLDASDAAFQEALTVFTPERDLVRYAGTTLRLAETRLAQGRFAEARSGANAAVAAYEQAEHLPGARRARALLARLPRPADLPLTLAFAAFLLIATVLMTRRSRA